MHGGFLQLLLFTPVTLNCAIEAWLNNSTCPTCACSNKLSDSSVIIEWLLSHVPMHPCLSPGPA